MEEFNIEASNEWIGRRIDKVLSEYFKDYSRSFIKKLFDDDLILVNGKKSKPGYNIKNGDILGYNWKRTLFKIMITNNTNYMCCFLMFKIILEGGF